MDTEEQVRRFLEEECYTTPEEQDPCKPLIIEDELVRLNPSFDPQLVQQEALEQEMERRRTNLGTSFFLNFDPICNLHQLSGRVGGWARQEIKMQLEKRFIEVFKAQFPDDPPSEGVLSGLKERLQVAICPDAQLGFNNGEVYLWLPGLVLNEEFVVKMLLALKKSLIEEPVSVELDEQKYQVLFYG